METPDHDTVDLKKPGGDTVRVSKRLAEVVSLLWGLGIETISCCEVSKTKKAHVGFASYETACKLDSVLQSFADLCNKSGLWLTGPGGTSFGRGSYLVPFDGKFELEPQVDAGEPALSVFLVLPAGEAGTLAAMLRGARVGSIEGFEKVTRCDAP